MGCLFQVLVLLVDKLCKPLRWKIAANNTVFNHVNWLTGSFPFAVESENSDTRRDFDGLGCQKWIGNVPAQSQSIWIHSVSKPCRPRCLGYWIHIRNDCTVDVFLHPRSLTVRPWKMMVGRRSFPFRMVKFQGLCWTSKEYLKRLDFHCYAQSNPMKNQPLLLLIPCLTHTFYSRSPG